MKKTSGYFNFRVILVACMVLLAGATTRVLSVPGSFGMYVCDNRPMTAAQVAHLRGVDANTLVLLETQRGLTVPEICIMPQSKLDRAVNRALHPNPDHPGEAVSFRKLQLQDENGFIPADGLVIAEEQIKAMLAEQTKGPVIDPDAAGISSGSWRWLGPGNIGGRVRSIVIHPTTPNVLWAGSVSGGIWKSTDSGASWQIQTDFLANMAVSTLVMDPLNSNILYAGTGEGFYNSDGIQGAGVFKTTNGGTTWSQLAVTNTSNWYYVNRLAISPNGATILAATNSGIWRSTNGGTSWTQVSTVRTLDINFDPTDSNKAIASGDADWGSGWAGYSINSGQTWTNGTGLPAVNRVEVAYAPSNPAVVYASVDVNSGEIWKSINGGASYSLANTGNNFLGGQGWYDNVIWVDPTNANTLVVGGIDLWRSTDGGVTLNKISLWWSAPDSAHADNHMIVQDPGFNGTTNRRVYFGNDGGVYRADDVYTVEGTNGWTELNNNLGITQFYGAAGNPTTGEIIGGTQDNGTLFYNPGAGDTENWTTTFGGDGGWSVADPNDPNYFYGEYVFLKLHRSSDRGVSAEYIYGDGKSAPYVIDDAVNNAANFIAPFILDPNNSDRLLAGGLSLWRTDDVKTVTTVSTGPSWTAIKAPAGSDYWSYISAIAVAEGNSDIIWVGHNNGDVYMTSNGTAASPSWTQVDINSPALPDRYITRITIDKNNHGRVYVTFGGFSSDNVWKTSNSGVNWSDVTGIGLTGLPNLPVRSLVIHPNNSNWLYVGTELGVFTSENAGASWTVPHDGPTNTSIDELFWMDTTLVAATHGRGLFKVNTLGSTCYSLTVQTSGSGSAPIVSPSNSIGCPSGQYQAGEIVSLTASPALDWMPGSWSGTNDDLSTSIKNAVTMPAGNHIVTVNYIFSPQPPTMPGNLTVSSTTYNTVTLSWQDTSINETGFKIYKWGYDGSQWTFIYLNSVLANISEYTDINLNCASNYYYEVSSYNAAGESTHAGWVMGTTSACPPSAFNKSTPSNGAVNQSVSTVITWAASTNATSYEYCYDTSNDNTCATWMGNGTSTSKSLSGLANGATYYWQVRAVNANGSTYANGASTAFWSFTTIPNPPSAFVKSSPVNAATNLSTSPTLVWDASSGATSYEYCYDTTNDNACASWTSNSTSTSKALSGLANSTTYYWQVRAINAGGSTYANGSNTAYWSFTTLPNPPSAFTKSSPVNGAINQSLSPTLVWGASSGAASYEYCYDTSNDNSCSAWVSNGVSMSKALSGLALNTVYYWQARAINPGGTTYANTGTWWSFTTVSELTPPTVLSITRLDPTPTNLVSIRFDVLFSEAVTGVDMSGPAFDDFNLTTSAGVSGSSVAGVSGSGAAYTVTVNTGSGNGTIRLNVGSTGSIKDLANNPLNAGFNNGEIYSVIKSATFADVPLSYWANTSIERLYTAGVTGGCSTVPFNYCPATSVTRAQMAIFLLRGMHGSAYTPPAATGTKFTDVPLGTFGAAWIEQLATEGITSGCGGGKYCPTQSVSRAQMAIFLVRARHGIAFVPPAATGIFPDVPVGSFGANYIEQLVADAITSGCGGGNYCPNTMVKRDSMAVFLVKTFNLP